jgi:hypothetical protein
MTLRQRLLLGGAGLLLAVVALFVKPPTTAAAPLGEQLTDAQFAGVRKAVQPAADEDDFAKIPWLTTIWDARVKAAKEGKPILLWEMDGHPLGCG